MLLGVEFVDAAEPGLPADGFFYEMQLAEETAFRPMGGFVLLEQVCQDALDLGLLVGWCGSRLLQCEAGAEVLGDNLGERRGELVVLERGEVAGVQNGVDFLLLEDFRQVVAEKLLRLQLQRGVSMCARRDRFGQQCVDVRLRLRAEQPTCWPDLAASCTLGDRLLERRLSSLRRDLRRQSWRFSLEAERVSGKLRVR